MKTLLVALDPSGHDLAMDALRARGHALVVTTSLDDAVAQLDAITGTALAESLLVVLDATALADAPEVCRKLRATTGGAGAFLLVLAPADGAVLAPCLAAGADDFALGPATPAALAARLVVAEQRMRATERGPADQDHRQMQTRLLLADRMISVGTLAAGVAHEINNPLTYVIANLDFVARCLGAASGSTPPAAMPNPPPPAERVARALAQAREGADRVRKIVRNLRTFSRGDEDRRGAVHVQQVLESSIDMAWNEIRHRAVLVRDYAAVSPVEANEARLGQVFLNLLVNAAHAIPEGHADANEIRVAVRPDPAGRVVIEVGDTGAGIPPEVLGRIFDPFFTTKPLGVGTGLGLSICHGIVTGLGGEITVHTTVGRGSTFRVVLPPAADDVPLVQSIPPSFTDGRRGRLAVIDDEPNLRASLGRILALEHDVDLCASAQEFLERVARGTRYDVILCDLMMPEMTGFDLYAALGERDPELLRRIVFVTGGAFTPQAQAFLEQIPNARIEKPFDLDELRALIRRRLT